MIYRSNSPQETRKIASNLAVKLQVRLVKVPVQVLPVIALEGELGAGKTTFAQAFVRALGIKTKVKSPTFNIIKKYEIRNPKFQGEGSHGGTSTGIASETNTKYKILNTKYIYHIDCYRLRDHKDIVPLGIKDIFKERNSIMLIEWPERIRKILPKKLIRVHIDHIDKNKRKITIDNP